MVLNKKIALFLLFIFFDLISFAQTAPLTYLVSFANKAGSLYSLNTPSAYLSARAIARRSVHAISIDSTDLPVNSWYIDSLNNISGVTVICKSKWFNNATIMVSDTSVLSQVQSIPFVSAIKSTCAGTPATIDPHVKTNVTPSRGNTYFFEDTLGYGAASNQVKMLNTQFLHQMGYRGEGMYIAIMDLGFREIDILPQYEHLRSTGRIIQGPDFVHRDGNVYNSNGIHGTLVMSCMAPYANGEFIGTAPEATYFLFVTENDSSEYVVEEDYWIAAAEWADSAGVDVFNTSLGYTKFDDTLQSHAYADMDGNTTRITRGVDMACKKGILSVNSAGNSGTNSWYYIGAPADCDSCLTVGAVRYDKSYAPFSSKGPSFDGRIKPTIATQGDSTYLIWPGNVIADGNGTSFSGPVMAGSAACLWQAFPGKSNMEIMQAIEFTASQYDSPDDFTGYGVPDMFRAWEYLSQKRVIIDNIHFVVEENPFHDNFSIIFYPEFNTDITMNLYDVQGRLVAQKSATLTANLPNKQVLDVHNNLLQPGMYFLKVSMPAGFTTVRLVKQ
jgi:serine protease AprX